MFAGAVDARERFFVQQTHKAVPLRHLLHDLHGQLVLVTGGVGVRIEGGHLVLGRGHFVVFRLGQNAQRPQRLVQIPHIGGDAGADRAIVVIVQFLPSGRFRAKERAARHAQVLAAFPQFPVNQKILLFRAHLRRNAARAGVPEQAQNAHRLPGQHIHGA